MGIKHLIGLRIKHLRQSKKITQERLVETMSISPKYLSNIERGKENPTLDLFIKLSNTLDVEISEIFNYEHEKTSKELKTYLADLLKNSNEAQLRLITKVSKAIYK